MRSNRSRILILLSFICSALVLSLSSGCRQTQNAASLSEAGEETLSQSEETSIEDFEPAESSPAELTFAEQAERVRSGESQTIRLTMSTITADDLKKLGEFANLQELLLDTGGINDESIAILNNLAALEHLRIRESRLTDAGISTLDPRKLANLKILNLPQAELTAASIDHLASFPTLIQLRLGGGGLDDSAAAALTKLPALRSLHVIGPGFTDAALESLAGVPKLASLYIDDCHLSDEAWKRLFKAKPTMHVHIDQQHHDRDPNHAHDAANQ